MNSSITCNPGIRRRRQQGGFTLMELMASVAILGFFLVMATDSVFTTMRALAPRETVAQLLQDTRDVSTLLQESVEKAGSGELFDRRRRESTFGIALIPRKVTGSEFGNPSATAVSSDGGSSESDEITLAGTFPVAGVIANDNGGGAMTITFVPVSRHSSTNSSISYRHFAYEFFNRLYSPREVSYYYPAIDLNSAGKLLMVRSFAVNGIGRYRMVRITDVATSPVETLAIDLKYQVEDQLPFNRWMGELESTGGTVGLYGSGDPAFGQYTGASLGCEGATDVNGIITAGAVTQGNIQTASGQRNMKCSVAALAYLHTYFVHRPTNLPPVLARYDYEGDDFPAQDSFTVLADGLEDIQVEYFFDGTQNGATPEPGAQGLPSIGVPVDIDALESEPITAKIIALNVSYIVGRDTGRKVPATSYPQLSNRTADLSNYPGSEYMTRMMMSTTFSLKSSRSQQLYGQVN